MRKTTFIIAFAMCFFGYAQQFEDSAGAVPQEFIQSTPFGIYQNSSRSSAVLDYTVDQTGTFNPIDISATGTNVPLADDEVSADLNIGFTFNFNGNDYTTFRISSNGFITFNTDGDNGCCSGDPLPTAGPPDNLIAFAWEDLDPGNGGQPAMNVVRYETVGTAPNRVLVVEFFNVDHFPTGNNVTAHTQLYETTNVIEIHTTSMPSDGGNHTQGLENATGSDAIATPGRNSTDWSATNDFVSFTPNGGGGGGGGGGPSIAYGPENVNAQFSSFDVALPSVLTAIGPIGTTSFENSGAINMNGDTAYVLGADGDFWSVDIASGVYTSLGTILPSTGGTWVGMELDRTTGIFYGLSGNFSVDNHLHTIDVGAGTATALPNPTGMPGGGIAIAIDGAGDMWGYDLVDDNFYSIDKTTGSATIVGPLGFNANFGQGMGYDPNNDAIYMTAFNGTAFQAELRLVDTSNGSSTVVGVLGSTTPGGLTQMGWVAIPSTTPPDNDICMDAFVINCDDTLSGDTSDGNTDTNGDGSPDEWFRFTGSGGIPQWVTVSTCDQAAYDTILTVYDSCGGSIIAQNDDGPGCAGFTSELSFLSDGTSTYYIAVDGFGGASGAFDLSITCLNPPPNDMIVNSIDVDEIGFPYTDPAVAMPAATLEDGNPSGCNIDGANGVWYNFVSVGNGTATAEIVSPAGASYVTFFKAPNEMAIETDLEYFFQVGNQCAPGTSANITTEAGQAYYLFVVNTGGVTDIVIDGTLLGVDENALEGFSFYPNPTDNILNLTSVELIENVAIYNLLGQQVLERDINASSSELNISALATGAYLMKVSINGQIGTYKVIKR